MRSVNEIKRIVKNLAQASTNTDGTINRSLVKELIEYISQGNVDLYHIKVEKTQQILLLKLYLRNLRSSIQADSITMTTVIDLNQTMMEKEMKHLKEAYHKEDIIFEKDPDMIAGVKLQIGWDVIDDTVKNKLHTL